MKKEIQIIGGETLGVRFTIRERRIYDIEEGDVVDLTDMVVIKKKNQSRASKHRKTTTKIRGDAWK